MLWQLLIGISFCIIYSVGILYGSKLNFNETVRYITDFITRLQPVLTTITQVYEWEAIITVMLEQESDTMEETFDKLMNKPEVMRKYKAKEKR